MEISKPEASLMGVDSGQVGRTPDDGKSSPVGTSFPPPFLGRIVVANAIIGATTWSVIHVYRHWRHVSQTPSVTSILAVALGGIVFPTFATLLMVLWSKSKRSDEARLQGLNALFLFSTTYYPPAGHSGRDWPLIIGCAIFTLLFSFTLYHLLDWIGYLPMKIDEKSGGVARGCQEAGVLHDRDWDE